MTVPTVLVVVYTAAELFSLVQFQSVSVKHF